MTASNSFGASKLKLIKWYKSQGFVENKGQNKDFRFQSGMIRTPKGVMSEENNKPLSLIEYFTLDEADVATPTKFDVNEFDKLNKKEFNKKFLFTASYSALIGGLTHILLDLPAHEQNMLFFPLVMPNPDFLLYTLIDFGPIYIGPIRIDGAVTVFGLIWNIEDIILLITSLYLLRYIKKRNLISKWYEES